jgi:hypothetical protein
MKGFFAEREEKTLLRFVYALVIATAMLPAMAGATAIPSPFTATYSVSFRGMHAGQLHSTLRVQGPGEFVYETRAKPMGVARLLISSKAVERSLMRIDAGGVRPLSWSSDDGRSGSDRDSALEFFWDQKRVSGRVEGKRVDCPTEPALQDRLSVQMAVITALLRAEEFGKVAIIDDEIKQYSYTRAGSQRIKTKAGEFETIIYESTRPGSTRISRFWHAPSLGFVPVRAEQVRKGKTETVMELVSMEKLSG